MRGRGGREEKERGAEGRGWWAYQDEVSDLDVDPCLVLEAAALVVPDLGGARVGRLVSLVTTDILWGEDQHTHMEKREVGTHGEARWETENGVCLWLLEGSTCYCETSPRVENTMMCKSVLCVST